MKPPKIRVTLPTPAMQRTYAAWQQAVASGSPEDIKRTYLDLIHLELAELRKKGHR